MGRSFAAESVTAIQKVRLEYRFQNQERRHLDYPLSDGRDAQWPQLAIRFLNPNPSHWLRPVSFLLQRLLDSIQKPRHSAVAFFDHLDRYAVHSGRASISLHPFPCRFQYVAPKDSVI